MKNNKEIEKTKEDKVADLLVKMTLESDVSLLMDETLEPHIILPTSQNCAYPVRSATYRRWLAGLYHSTTGKGFSGSTFETVMATLEGKCYSDDYKETLYNRVARVGDEIYYDLCGTHVVKIDKNGWQTVKHSPVIFRRYNHQLPQVEPISGGDINKFLEYTNLKSEEDKLLILSYLVSVFIPDIPRVVLAVVGDQGSSKSTLLKLLRSLIDPSRTPLLRIRSSSDEMSQTASHHFCYYLDNVSYLNSETSDSLATFTTGIATSKRKLFSDNEDIIQDIKTAVGISGVSLMATKPDLLDRSLILELQRIPDSKRLEEKVFWDSFDEDKPSILGAIFDLLSKSLNIFEDIKLEKLPRMADFARWATTASVAMGYSKEDFINAYKLNVKRQNGSAVDSSPTAQAIIEFMKEKTEWRGSPSELYEVLKPIVETLKLQIGGSSGFPKSSSWLVRKINDIRTNLTSMGFVIETGNRTEVSKEIKISKDIKNDGSGDNAVSQPQNSLTPFPKPDGIIVNGSSKYAVKETDAVRNAVKDNQPQNDGMTGMPSKLQTLDSLESEANFTFTEKDFEKVDALSKERKCNACGSTDFYESTPNYFVCSTCHPKTKNEDIPF